MEKLYIFLELRICQTKRSSLQCVQYHTKLLFLYYNYTKLTSYLTIYVFTVQTEEHKFELCESTHTQIF